MKVTLLSIILFVLSCNFAPEQNTSTSKIDGETSIESSNNLDSKKKALNNHATNDDKKTYKERGIAISFNKDWNIKINKSKVNFLQAFSPKGNTTKQFIEFVVVGHRKEDGLSLDEYSMIYRGTLSSTEENFKLISNKSVVISDIKWQKIVYSAASVNKKFQLIYEVYMCTDGKDNYYTITCCSDSKSYPNSKPKFKEIITSVKLL